jgi:ligand-binding sensor domain-containing protein
MAMNSKFSNMNHSIEIVFHPIILHVYLKMKDGNIWIGTKDGGLNLYNRQTRQFTRYLKDKDNFKGPNSAYITCIYQSSNGNIWVGTKDAGINEFDVRKKNIQIF